MTTTPEGKEPRFELTGGRPCLDFVNTVGGDRHGQARERLNAYGDLVAWARQVGAVEAAHAARLLAEARRHPAQAAAVLGEALALREALFEVLAATAAGRAAPAAALALVSSSLGRALAHRRLDAAGGGLALAWDDAPGALDAPVWRVAASAADLLTSRDRERVRVCGLHETRECSWVFLDTTRAGTRRWCSMRDCGNRAKARRHYARVKGDEA